MKITNYVTPIVALTSINSNIIQQVSAARVEYQEVVDYHNPQECMNILQAALATCALTGPYAPICVGIAWGAYALCTACDC